ncbi:MAG: hypothetical protein ACYDC4_14130 [Candidatus Dormibacteria bacterium]
MDRRSRRNDHAVSRAARPFRAGRGAMLVLSIGIIAAVAACGQVASGPPGGTQPGTGWYGPFGTAQDGAPHAGFRPAGSPPGAGGLGRTVGDYAAGAVTASGAATPSGTVSGVGTSTPGPRPAAPGARNKFLWPFASSSIWNMPIGSGANYVAAHLALPTMKALTADQNMIVMDPSAPLLRLDYNGAGWSNGNRCTGSGSVLASVPIPPGFTVPSDGHNDPLAVVMPDGQTVIQGQPFARCTPGGPATVLELSPSVNLYGNGMAGGGGAGLGALGGTIRLNELVPGGAIRHALKVDVDAARDLFPTPAFRWPAIHADACAPGCYGGGVPALTMGSLLALPARLDLAGLGLETVPGQMLAWTLQNYGAYVTNDTTRSVFSITTEDGPSGSVVNQFQQVWGFPFAAPAGNATPWSHDINLILANLAVVANNGPASVGGGGTPLQPLAPGFSN